MPEWAIYLVRWGVVHSKHLLKQKQNKEVNGLEQLYLDHAATSMPKAPGVSAAMVEYLEQVGVSINRSMYQPAQKAAMTTLALRSKLADFLECRMPAVWHLPPATPGG